MNFGYRKPTEHIQFEILEHSPLPTAIFLTEDLIIELANEAILAIWDKDRSVIGKPLEEALPELTGQPFLSIIKSVWKTGVTYAASNTPVTLNVNGIATVCYFELIFKALKDEKGRTRAIINTVTDVSERHILQSKIDEVQAALMREKSHNEELVAINENLQEKLSVLNENLEARVFDRTAALSESRFRFMLNAIPQQVWTSTPEGALDYVNQVVCENFGYSTEEIVGHGWQKFIHPDDIDQCLKKWMWSLETGKPYMIEFRLLFSNGTYRWHLGRAIPYVENGITKLWLGTNTDIEIQKENEIKKDEFLSIASHELKTPLTSIKAFNQLLQRVSDPVKMNKFVQKSSEHIVRLERLISDLLDVTKINAGKMQYTMEPFNFGDMIRESVNTLRHTSTDHQILLENSVELEYIGDQFRLELVLNNFISNAIKYSPEGKTILVKSRINGGNIVVSVQDFGIGIAQENLDKLFDRYYRVDNTAMRFEGLGLGLFISSEILKRHKGSFWIESKEGDGSTFYFGLPLDPSEESKVLENTDFYYQDSTVKMSYNPSKKRIELDWTGFQNFDTVQNGCLRALKMIILHSCTSVLNDNRNVLGTWSEASDWAGGVFFPMMEKEGIKRLAWIFSPSVFSQLSAKKSVDVDVSNISTQFFTDLDDAKRWLDEKEG